MKHINLSIHSDNSSINLYPILYLKDTANLVSARFMNTLYLHILLFVNIAERLMLKCFSFNLTERRTGPWYQSPGQVGPESCLHLRA